VGQLLNALKTNIISGLAFRGKSNTNCKDNNTELLNKLQSHFSTTTSHRSLYWNRRCSYYSCP